MDAPTSRDSRRTFDPASVSACFRARCLASCRQVLRPAARDLSPALAPASGLRSCRTLLPPLDRSPRVSAALHIRSAEAASLNRSQELRLGGLRRFRCTSARPGSWPVRCHRVAPALYEADLPLAEASRMPSPDRRVDRCHRHPWDQNPGNFRALRPAVPVVSCPEDSSKVRLNRRSDNI